MSGTPAVVEFRTRRGRIRTLLTIAVASLAVIAAFLSGFPIAVRGALALAVAAFAVAALRRGVAHRVALPRHGPGRLDGHAGTLSASTVTPLFIALHLDAPSGRRHRAGIFRDELPAEQFRALLAFLRSG